jgi:5-methylcytosine-specific restriction endonuclease McrA
MILTKQCKDCGSEKPTLEFMRGIHSHHCKSCWTIYTRKYTKRRDKRLKAYGISIRAIKEYGLENALFAYDRAVRQCEKCGEKYDLTIHHIDGQGRHNKERGLFINNRLDNLQVLCRRCHGSLHGKENRK